MLNDRGRLDQDGVLKVGPRLAYVLGSTGRHWVRYRRVQTLEGGVLPPHSEGVTCVDIWGRTLPWPK